MHQESVDSHVAIRTAVASTMPRDVATRWWDVEVGHLRLLNPGAGRHTVARCPLGKVGEGLIEGQYLSADGDGCHAAYSCPSSLAAPPSSGIFDTSPIAAYCTRVGRVRQAEDDLVLYGIAAFFSVTLGTTTESETETRNGVSSMWGDKALSRGQRHHPRYGARHRQQPFGMRPSNVGISTSTRTETGYSPRQPSRAAILGWWMDNWMRSYPSGKRSCMHWRRSLLVARPSAGHG